MPITSPTPKACRPDPQELRTLETAHDTCGDYRKRDFGDGMDAAPTHEQLTRMVAKLEATLRELEEQNVVLRRSAVDFGALADRSSSARR